MQKLQRAKKRTEDGIINKTELENAFPAENAWEC